jgi:protein-S-isoprenylcysteine O-methyltransferase Ste14
VLLPYNWSGLAVVLCGLILGATGSRTFIRLRTNLNTFRNPNILVTDGVFSVSRNPMYLGFTLVLAGVVLIIDWSTPLVFVLAFFAAAQFWYIPFEERRMRETFGDLYLAYCRKTRRWV